MSALQETQGFDLHRLLIKGGFVPKTTIPNLYTKRQYKAVVWKNGCLTISHYSPNVQRLLFQNTYRTQEEIAAALQPHIEWDYGFTEYILQQQGRVI